MDEVSSLQIEYKRLPRSRLLLESRACYWDKEVQDEVNTRQLVTKQGVQIVVCRIWIASLTDKRFLLLQAYKLGARYLGAWPSNQADCQKWSLLPSPNSDCGGSVEKLSINLITWDFYSYPWLGVTPPIVLEPM